MAHCAFCRTAIKTDICGESGSADFLFGLRVRTVSAKIGFAPVGNKKTAGYFTGRSLHFPKLISNRRDFSYQGGLRNLVCLFVAGSEGFAPALEHALGWLTL